MEKRKSLNINELAEILKSTGENWSLKDITVSLDKDGTINLIGSPAHATGAAMREAIEHAASILEEVGRNHGLTYSDAQGAARTLRAALSSPAPEGEAALPDDLTAAYMAGFERGKDAALALPSVKQEES